MRKDRAMTERSPIVSIIVPVYGAEAYLPACIESLCRQTYPHIRIILVDDQSPDGCPEICDRYAEQDSRIVVIHQENKGVSGARNTGLEHARGDYVMFVDSDDELYPDAVEILLQDAEKYGADLVSAAMESAKTPREQEAPYTVFRGEESLVQSLNGHPGTVSACAKLYRSDLIRDIRFEEGKNINEDGFFVFRCCVQKPIFVQHDIMVYMYNEPEGSNSRQRFSEKHLSILYYCNRKKEIVASQFPHFS
jgi:glycosyltransferase involved in cell wall biosynthesis